MAETFETRVSVNKTGTTATTIVLDADAGRVTAGGHSSAGAVTFLPPDGFAFFHIDNGPAGGRPTGRLRVSHGSSPGSHELVSVLQNGNVGIATSSPAVKLHVVGNRVRLESGGKQMDLRADGSAVDIQSDTHNLYVHSRGPSGRNHVIMNPFSGEGNVGIGTQAPSRKLHVVGDRIRLESGGKQMDLRADGAAVDIQSDTHSLYLHSSGPSGRNHVIMNPFGGEGNVGIGTQVPSDKLHVVGNVRANDFLVTSDARLKTEICPIRGAAEKLQRMRGVEFRWLPEASGSGAQSARRGTGVIAQEVELVAPELVSSELQGEYRSVNVSGLIGMLIEAFKDLSAENRELKGRIEALENPGAAACLAPTR